MTAVQGHRYPGFSLDAFHHTATGTWSYLLVDDATGACAVIDPVLDFDPATGRVSTSAVRAIADTVRQRGARLEWVLETHVHADHLSGCQALRDLLGGRCATSSGLSQAQRAVGALFGIVPPDATDTRFDALLREGDVLRVGETAVTTLHTPGHTPHCLTYRVDHRAGTLLFVGDTLLPPTIGTARCDFPGGSAEDLYVSVKRILAFPAATEVFVCHDYPAAGASPSPRSTVEDHQVHNVHWRDRPTAAAFVARRLERDRTLALPALFEPSLRFNLGLPPA